MRAYVIELSEQSAKQVLPSPLQGRMLRLWETNDLLQVAPIDASRGTGAHLQVHVTPGPPSFQQSLLLLLIFFLNSVLTALLS